MREIKFRAWDDENNKMIKWHPDFFYDTSAVTGYSGSFDMIEMPLMQYTGLKDKNGVEIYEGDIAQSKYFYASEVKFVDGEFRFEDVSYADSMCYEDNEWEVIGSIHENPELLGDTQ